MAPTTPASPPPICAPEVVPEGVHQVDPDGPDTQIHVFSAAGTDGVWVAYNLPDVDGSFDVWAVHVACDGATTGPFQLDDSNDNEIDPAVAVLGDVALVAWQSDSGVFPDNLDVRWRLVGLDGPRGPVIEAPTPGNTRMPALVATDAGFVVAGTTAGVQVFEVFTLALDAAGQPVADPIDFDMDPGLGEFWPDIAVDEGGQLHVAWEVDEQIVWAVDGAASLVGSGIAPSVSAGPHDVRLAYGLDGDLWTTRLGGAPVRLRGGDELQHSVSIVEGPDDGIAGFMVNLGGLDNRVVVARYDQEGLVQTQQDLGTDTAAPYGLEIVRLAPDVVFVAWSEGTSPLFRARQAFVRLE